MIQSDRERQAPTSVDAAEPSHLARYIFASDFLKAGSRVLDAPCGTGYGTSRLARSGAHVTGVDIFDGAVQHANEFFGSVSTLFKVGDIERLGEAFEHHSFDSVVSFEGIEHIKHPERFLEGVRHCMKPGGVFIVSTPRRPHGNPFHFQEWNLEEYEALLKTTFEIKKMYGQIFTDIFDLALRPEDPDAHKHFNFVALCTYK